MTLNAAPLTYQPCPQCKSPMPIARGFVTWCEQCNWNVRPEEKTRHYTIQERIMMRFGQRAGRALVDEFKHAPPAKPAIRLSTILAFVIAALIHGLTLLAVLLGARLLFAFWEFGNWFALLGAVILLGIASLTRPYFRKLPPVLPRDRFPALYGLVDQIGAAMGSRKVTGIAISGEYNASFGRFGWQQKEVLFIGLPLFLTAKGQEKVALIGHELAHGVSGDPLRGMWLRSAIGTMQEWVYLLRPAAQNNVMRGTLVGSLVDISSLFGNLLGAVVEKFVYAVQYALSVLVFRDSQRAEYRADYLAAQVSGTNGVLRLLDKMYFASGFYTIVQHLTYNSTEGQDLFDHIERYIAALPAREKTRLHRANLAEGARLDASHPPTSHRIEVLEAHPNHIPGVALASDVEAQIEQELEKLRLPIQQIVVDAFRQRQFY